MRLARFSSAPSGRPTGRGLLTHGQSQARRRTSSSAAQMGGMHNRSPRRQLMKSPSNGVLVREPHVRIRRAVERRAWMAKDAARELPNLPLEDLLHLVHLYAERARRSTRGRRSG